MITTENFQPKNPLNTPILFLVFNRLDTTKDVFKSIRHAKPPRLYIASDGPRAGRDDELKIVKEVRAYLLNRIDWKCEVKTLFRDNNLGCKYAVSSAISWFFENEEQGIILEDDCLPTQSFFWYCEVILQKYKDDEKIWHVSGNNFQKNGSPSDFSYYFSKHNHIWGWATWANRWKCYDVEMKSYTILSFDKELEHFFDDQSERSYWSNIFDKCKKGLINTWDYQWTYTVWKNNGLTIAPNVNLVSNIGFGEYATHTRDSDSEQANMPVLDLEFPIKHPHLVERNKSADMLTTKKLFSKQNFFNRLIKRTFVELKIFLKKYLP